jgi:FAD binding domain/Berberine and berberine like
MQSTITRRRFLLGSARLAVVAGVGAACAPAARPELAVYDVPPSAWSELGRRLSGRLLRPGAAGWSRIVTPNNLVFNTAFPAGVARCVSADDVAQSVLWAREYRVPFVAQCGGHSYAGYSTTPGLMIDLEGLKGVDFDPATRVATVGGGVRNSTLYPALQRLGVTITHGRCPTVGVGGFFLGGGIGFNMRAHGLACDQLVATQIVTADGQLQTIDGRSELFWACRGGAGGNFGINTSFSVQTFNVPPSLTVFSLSWSARPREVYGALMGALTPAPAALGSRLQITAGQPPSVQLLGQLVGTPEELRSILRPAYAVAAPDSEQIKVMDYWTGQTRFLNELGEPGFYQERSRFFRGALSPAAMDTAFDWARRWPGTTQGSHMVLFQTGRQVNALRPDATAFAHRDSDWLMTINLSWGTDTSDELLRQNREWLNGFYAAMIAFATPGSYQNFPDPSLTNYLESYYLGNLGKLRRIKKTVDPTRVFIYPQAIPPA